MPGRVWQQEQEAEISHFVCIWEAEREREREITGSGPRFQTLKAGTQHFSSSKAVPPKGSRTFLDSEANFRPSVQACELLEDIFHSNHHRGAGQHPLTDPQTTGAAGAVCHVALGTQQ